MKEFMIKGKKKLCFVLKEGELNDIVVTYDSLAPIDLKRFYEMEGQGGDLMRVMRDTTLDNGVNALNMYEDLLVPVPVEIKNKKDIDTVSVDNVSESPVQVKKKRGRGRPRRTT
jgi:hypothetical protein